MYSPKLLSDIPKLHKEITELQSKLANPHARSWYFQRGIQSQCRFLNQLMGEYRWLIRYYSKLHDKYKASSLETLFHALQTILEDIGRLRNIPHPVISQGKPDVGELKQFLRNAAAIEPGTLSGNSIWCRHLQLRKFIDKLNLTLFLIQLHERGILLPQREQVKQDPYCLWNVHSQYFNISPGNLIHPF